MNTSRFRGSIARLGIALTLTYGGAVHWVEAATILSSGHADIFEAEYELPAPGSPELHLGVHTDDGHFEPGDVILQVKNSARTSTDGLPSPITTILGTSAWILPVDLEQAAALGVLEAGVARAAGFPDASAVTYTMVASGASNPGNFVLFTAGNTIRLSAIGGTVGTGSFSVTASHIHYNWGFSESGIYTFDMQASYVDPVHGLLQSPVETYTFQVVPEPATWALAGGVAVGALGLRRRLRRGSRVRTS